MILFNGDNDPTKKHIFETGQLCAIGSGGIGGKAQGLFAIQKRLITELDPNEFPNISVDIPQLVVICTDVFDTFMSQNNLYEIAYSDMPDDRIANAFQRADLPFEILRDLRLLIEQIHTPLAIRSSSCSVTRAHLSQATDLPAAWAALISA